MWQPLASVPRRNGHIPPGYGGEMQIPHRLPISMSAEITKPESVRAVHGRFKSHRQMGLSFNIGVGPPIVGDN